jgi:hypothetical protein
VDSRRSRVDNIFIQKSIVMGIGAMTEDDLDLSDSSLLICCFELMVPSLSFIDTKVIVAILVYCGKEKII